MRVPEQACQAISPAACRIPTPSSDQRAEGRLQGRLTSTHRSGVNHSLCLLWGLASGPCVSVESNREGVCPWDSVAVGCPSVILGPAGNQTVSRKSRTWVPSSCALSWGGGGDGAASPGPGEPARLPVLPALPQPGDGVALSSQTAAHPLIRSFQPLLGVLQAQVAQSCLAVFPHAGSSPPELSAPSLHPAFATAATFFF